jgi:branched-chain amino acid transport system substrate-binding protein
MQLLFAAMQTQTEVTSETIRDGLYQIEYQGITGTIKFEETGDPIKSVAIWQISEGDRRCYQMINP